MFRCKLWFTQEVNIRQGYRLSRIGLVQTWLWKHFYFGANVARVDALETRWHAAGRRPRILTHFSLRVCFPYGTRLTSSTDCEHPMFCLPADRDSNCVLKITLHDHVYQCVNIGSKTAQCNDLKFIFFFV